MVYWHRFSYAFPFPLESQAREQKIVYYLSLGAVVAGIVYTLHYFRILAMGEFNSPPPLLYMSVMVSIEICWSIGVFIRRTVALSQNKDSGFWARFLHPEGRDAIAVRGFSLLFIIPILAISALLLRDLALISSSMANFVLTLSILIFYLFFTMVYLNYSRETNSFIIKSVGVSLVLVLILLGTIGYLVFPSLNKEYHYKNLPEKHACISFEPLAETEGYRVNIREGDFDTNYSITKKLAFSNRQYQMIPIPFSFPYAGKEWNKLYVHTNGIVTFGSPSFSSAIITNLHPAIAPLWASMTQDHESGIFFHRENGKAVITWVKMLESETGKRLTFQLKLFENGMIHFEYLHIQGACPRLVGLVSGNGYGRMTENLLSRQFPFTTSSPAIVENYYRDYRQFIHKHMFPLMIIVVISTLLILFLFTPFFKLNLSRPLNTILMGLRKVEKGDLSIQLPLQYNDEIGILTQSFNHMVRSLKEAKDGWSQATLIKDQLLALNQSILDTAADGIITLDAEGVILSFNKAAERMFKYSREEIIGKNFQYLLNSDKDESETFEVQKNIQTPGEQKRFGIESQFKGRQKGGDTFPLEFAISATESSGKQIFTIILRDLTEQQRMAQEKLKLEEQLHQSQKLETIGTLAGGVAHDFNNILTPIIGYTEMALEDIPDDTVTRRYMENILKSCNRARDLVRQILTFSRKTPAVFELVDMLSLVKGGLNLIRASTPSTINFNLDIDCHECTVFGDRTQLEQVLINLCTNASHAMIPGGGSLKITVKLEKVDEALASQSPALKQEMYVLMEVKDSGTGMEHSTLKQIFDPFFTTKPVGQGTGLGLSVVHGIVEKHGGAILVRSEPGKGSTFSVYFPAIQAKELEKEMVIEEIKRGSERILLVDDEELITSMYQEALERAGYQVSAFCDSINTLEAFQDDPDGYDMLITDNTMPYLTGLQLSESVRMIRKNIPIILFTGNSNMISDDVCQRLGINKVLSKPVYFSTLTSTIRDLLNEELTL